MTALRAELEHIRSTRYTLEQVESALTALALAGGNVNQASRTTGIPVKTLEDWRVKVYPKRYQQAAAELAPQLEQIIVDTTRQAIINAGHVEAKLLARLNDEADDIPSKELPGALRNVSTSKAINTDKLLALTGRPTSVIEHRTVDQALKQLETVIGKSTLLSQTPAPQAETPSTAQAHTHDASARVPVSKRAER